MSRSFFLAGTMQGRRRGAEMIDQGYRAALADVIARWEPDARIHDPLVLMAQWFADREQEIRSAHAVLANARELYREDMTPDVIGIIDAFHRLTAIAADSDVCVAWLPDHEPSMGTAAEMQRAYHAGRTVVAITDMRQNLAVLACSTVILPDLAAFAEWLDRTRAPSESGSRPIHPA
ncbi:hypothetical protein [Actinokineospora xionganensis]|uniref:Uncharacterized protein n=1 Tax=Actinokineospora xionganensis TaxID=2684470 RepID=A0ABR7L037_9PSEU|nr:hypothetical protein [Actinokineospora xionganensis]MBC6445962.1 hypothetical protein [Actinokineospora xionganensis]